MIEPERKIMFNLISLRPLVVAVAMLALSRASFAQVDVAISVSSAPPELPVYEQPICPGEGYIWTPGYWAWDEDGADYYWVPGTWVMAPQVGYFWTPSWWDWGGNAFIFHEGYWGPVVGFYGGINYGYGYSGSGYEGGRWEHDRFYYNRSVNNVNVTTVHNVYNTTVVNNYNTPRPSFNGPNGVSGRPTPQEEAAMHERHIPPVPLQTQHIQAARSNSQLRASVNRGKPPIAATPKPAAFNERGVVPTKAGVSYSPPPRSANDSRPANTNSNANGNANANAHPVHPNDVPPHPRPEAPNTGDQKQNQQYQQQQKLYAQQQAEHQKLQQKQDQEHQKLAEQQQDAAKKQQMQQQMEQKHQQETQQMEQKHAQQQQQMKAPPQPHSAPPTPQQAPPPAHQNQKPPQ
jgi:YXWGXW repeat-containing protein